MTSAPPRSSHVRQSSSNNQQNSPQQISSNNRHSSDQRYQRATSASRPGYSSSTPEEIFPPRAKKSIGNYRLSKTIGQGSMGKVKLAVHNITGEKFACKVIPRPAGSPPVDEMIGPTTSIRDLPAANETVIVQSKKTDDTKETRIIREAAILLLLEHPHIVKLHDIVLFENFYYFFFELVNGGQMLDYIISHGKLKEKHARKFIRQIISAVDYCHKNNIVHRDLKIENILIDQSGSINLYFAAPELLNAKAYIGPEVDIWSLGIVLFVLVCGKVPFDDTSMAMLHSKIKAGIVEYPSHVSTDCRNLISRMLDINPAQRASMSEVKNNIWMIKDYNGVPANYLPIRSPLRLPLDTEVIRRMKGFEFGSDKDIYSELEAFVTYSALESSSYEGNQLAIVSIYYLVQEKMQRQKKMSISILKTYSDTSVTEIHSASSQYQIEYPPPLIPRSATESAIYDNNQRRQNAIGENMQPFVVTSENSIQFNNNRYPDYSKFEKPYNPAQPVQPAQNMNVPEESNNDGRVIVKNKISQVFGNRTKTSRNRSQSTSVAPTLFKRDISNIGTTDFINQIRGKKLESPPSSPGHFRNENNFNSNDSILQTETSFPQRKSMDKHGRAKSQQIDMYSTPKFDQSEAMPIYQSSTITSRSQIREPKQRNHRSQSRGHDENRTISRSNSFTLSGKHGRADEYVRSVNLKGLFSVVNTSTKSASAIRDDLYRVFILIGLTFHECYGGFQCTYDPTFLSESRSESAEQLFENQHNVSAIAKGLVNTRKVSRKSATSPPASPNTSSTGSIQMMPPAPINIAINPNSGVSPNSPLSPRNSSLITPNRRTGKREPLPQPIIASFDQQLPITTTSPIHSRSNQQLMSTSTVYEHEMPLTDGLIEVRNGI
ncbi:serine/threonine-protein kinase KIN2, partial [Nowakowskiella sp. JEL0078]